MEVMNIIFLLGITNTVFPEFQRTTLVLKLVDATLSKVHYKEVTHT
jgi:hypothetical protein